MRARVCVCVCVCVCGFGFYDWMGVFMSRECLGMFLSLRWYIRCELTFSGPPSRRLSPGCLWGIPCLGDRYVVFVGFVGIDVAVRFDVVDFVFEILL